MSTTSATGSSITMPPSAQADEPCAARPHPRCDKPYLSIVVPTYNEEGNIPLLAAALHAQLAKMKIESYEIIFVNDGSTDRSADEIKAEIAKDRRVRLISFKKNAGETAANEGGIRNARGDVVVVMDCDLQNDPRDLPALLSKIGEYDCVCGWRTNRGEGDGILRRISSRIANFVRARLSGEKIEIHDSGCTYRAFRRECMKNVKFYRGMHRFIPTLLEIEGYKVTEVPVRNNPRRFGKSKYGVWNRVFAASLDLLAVRWMRSRTIHWEVGEEA